MVFVKTKIARAMSNDVGKLFLSKVKSEKLTRIKKTCFSLDIYWSIATLNDATMHVAFFRLSSLLFV